MAASWEIVAAALVLEPCFVVRPYSAVAAGTGDAPCKQDWAGEHILCFALAKLAASYEAKAAVALLLAGHTWMEADCCCILHGAAESLWQSAVLEGVVILEQQQQRPDERAALV